jgi:hypothetical protein
MIAGRYPKVSSFSVVFPWPSMLTIFLADERRGFDTFAVSWSAALAIPWVPPRFDFVVADRFLIVMAAFPVFSLSPDGFDSMNLYRLYAD